MWEGEKKRERQEFILFSLISEILLSVHSFLMFFILIC